MNGWLGGNVMNIFTRKLEIGLICLCAATLLLVLSGCVVGPKYHPPATQAPAAVYKESPTQFKETEGWTVAQPADAKLRGKWWEIFNDPELNALEDQLDIAAGTPLKVTLPELPKFCPLICTTVPALPVAGVSELIYATVELVETISVNAGASLWK